MKGIDMNSGVLPIRPNNFHLSMYILLVFGYEFVINDGNAFPDMTVGVRDYFPSSVMGTLHCCLTLIAHPPWLHSHGMDVAS